MNPPILCPLLDSDNVATLSRMLPARYAAQVWIDWLHVGVRTTKEGLAEIVDTMPHMGFIQMFCRL